MIRTKKKAVVRMSKDGGKYEQRQAYEQGQVVRTRTLVLRTQVVRTQVVGDTKHAETRNTKQIRRQMRNTKHEAQM